MPVQSLYWEDPLEKEMATHSSIPAWDVPWTEEPDGLQSTGSQRVGHDWMTEHAHTKIEMFSSEKRRLPQFTELPWWRRARGAVLRCDGESSGLVSLYHSKWQPEAESGSRGGVGCLIWSNFANACWVFTKKQVLKWGRYSERDKSEQTFTIN